MIVGSISFPLRRSSSFSNMRRRRWTTGLSDFTWPKEPIRARQGCCSMSCRPRMTSARPWRSLPATAGSSTKRARQAVRAPEGVVVETGFVGLSRYSAKQATEFGVALTIKALREIAGRKIHPTNVGFIHGRNSKLRSFERFFRCPVEFGDLRDQFALSHETLAVPLVTEDRYLLGTLQPFCDKAARSATRRSRRSEPWLKKRWKSSCRMARRKNKPSPRRSDIRARTLSRRLAVEETTYEEGVDQLREPRAPVSQGSGHVPFPDRLAVGLRGDRPLQPCFQTLDRTFAVRGPKEKPLPAAA